MSQPLAAWRASYTPGHWVVLTGPTSLVVLQPAPARVSGLLGRFWDDMLQATSLDGLAATLRQHNLAELAGFGLFYWDDGGLRASVRGSVQLTDMLTGVDIVASERPTLLVDAAFGQDWAVRIQLEPIDAAEVLQLPLLVGGVTASSVTMGVKDGALVSSAQSGQLPGAVVADEAGEPSLVDDNAWSGAILEEDDAPVPDEVGGEEPSPEGQELTGQIPDSDELPAPDEAADAAPEAAVEIGLPVEASGTVPVPPPAVPAPGAVGIGMVSAVVCGLGHANPPGAQICRQCRGPLGEAVTMVPRPKLALIRSSFGVSLDLTSVILVGRAPDTRGDTTVQVLKVPSPNTDISRSHLRIQARDWHIEVTDMNSTNGSTLAVPGEPPVRMQPGQPVTVPLGTIVDLGDGVQIRIDPPRS